MFRALLLGFALLLAGGCGSKQAASDADPALWVVKDADTTIYLFGTVHMLKPGLSWFDEAVRKAFDQSGELVLELKMPPQAEMQALVSELGMTPAPSLPEQLPADALARLRATLSEAGHPTDTLDRAEPWLAATMLSSMPLHALGYDEKHGVEQTLAAAATGKKITGLETAREQLGYFDALPLPAQRTLLLDTIKELDQTGSRVDQVVATWAKGDPETLGNLMNEDLARSPELAKALLETRNRNWSGWIAQRMQQPGTVFVAVGAGHLAGAQSVQAMLAAKGLKAERVAY
jgi:uncharacterized protein YbaP (TraB family)